jgi:F0F1-type ATP synthase membrane subunit c/vacuolar-type H+-ATPase subunit K
MPKILLVFTLLFFFAFSKDVLAQTPPPGNSAAQNGAASLGVAKMVSINEKDVKDGSLISSSTEGVKLSKIPYDPQILGVVARDAGIIISSNTEDKNALPVISSGSVYVLVSSKNGVIKKGDIITSSTIPGVAVKAVKSGYVLGYAMEEYNDSDANKTGKIAVDLSLHYFNSRSTLVGTLTDIFKIALLPTKDSPNAIFKYIVAALVVLGSFILGFITFGRTAAKGVEALGRNPAASKTIHLGIILNVSVVIIIILAGITVAFFILRL